MTTSLSSAQTIRYNGSRPPAANPVFLLVDFVFDKTHLPFGPLHSPAASDLGSVAVSCIHPGGSCIRPWVSCIHPGAGCIHPRLSWIRPRVTCIRPRVICIHPQHSWPSCAHCAHSLDFLPPGQHAFALSHRFTHGQHSHSLFSECCYFSCCCLLLFFALFFSFAYFFLLLARASDCQILPFTTSALSVFFSRLQSFRRESCSC